MAIGLSLKDTFHCMVLVSISELSISLYLRYLYLSILSLYYTFDILITSDYSRFPKYFNTSIVYCLQSWDFLFLEYPHILSYTLIYSHIQYPHILIYYQPLVIFCAVSKPTTKLHSLQHLPNFTHILHFTASASSTVLFFCNIMEFAHTQAK